MRKLFILFTLLLILVSRIANAQEVCPVKHPALTALDHTSMLSAYTASFRGIYGRNPTLQPGSGVDDGNYWISVSDHYGEFGDTICRAGWSAYWEQKLTGQDAVDPRLGDQPARFLPTNTPPPAPPTPPVPPPAPLPTVVTCDLSALSAQITAVNANVSEGRAENREFYQAVGIQWKKITLFAAKYGSAILAGFLTHQATK